MVTTTWGNFVSFLGRRIIFQIKKHTVFWNVFGFKRYWCVGKNWALVLFSLLFLIGFFSSKKTGPVEKQNAAA